MKKIYKNIDPLKDPEYLDKLVLSEYKCRKKLADNLPDHLRGYYGLLLNSFQGISYLVKMLSFIDKH